MIRIDRVIQRLLVTCNLQRVEPYAYLVDVLQRVGRHPAKHVVELTPRVWKTTFADQPLRSDLDRTRDPPPPLGRETPERPRLPAYVQGPQARPGHPAGFPSTREPDRGAHLCRLHRLLPARHPEEPGPATGTGANSAADSGEVLHHATGRCTRADHRRAASGAAPANRSHPGSAVVAPPTLTAIAGSATATHLALKTGLPALLTNRLWCQPFVFLKNKSTTYVRLNAELSKSG